MSVDGMKTSIRGLLAAGGAVIALSAPVQALPLALDGGWQFFTFAEVGSDWSEDFTFSLAGNAYLAVTDAFLAGDQFEFFINAAPVGLTSLPTALGDDIGNDPDSAFADDRWSSAEVLLGPGDYVVTGSTVLSPFDAGGAYIQLTSTELGGPDFNPRPPSSNVPLPAAAWLLAAGVAGLGALKRRRKA